ncbi:MAG: histidine kinase, partial [Streptosporangiaceae bacterium]
MEFVEFVVFAVVIAAVAVVLVRLRRRDLGGSVERATYETLHRASMAAPPLRSGLTRSGAEKAVKHLRELLGTAGLAITGTDELLAHEICGSFEHAKGALSGGRTRVLDLDGLYAVVVPLTADGRVVGTLIAYDAQVSAGLVRATEEVARWVGTQLELAELDRSRTLLVEAEVRALRAQISPHFVYNSLTAIASFTRSD